MLFPSNPLFFLFFFSSPTILAISLIISPSSLSLFLCPSHSYYFLPLSFSLFLFCLSLSHSLVIFLFSSDSHTLPLTHIHRHRFLCVGARRAWRPCLPVCALRRSARPLPQWGKLMTNYRRRSSRRLAHFNNFLLPP